MGGRAASWSRTVTSKVTFRAESDIRDATPTAGRNETLNEEPASHAGGQVFGDVEPGLAPVDHGGVYLCGIMRSTWPAFGRDCMMRWNGQGNAESQHAVVAGASPAPRSSVGQEKEGTIASRPSSPVSGSRGQLTCSGSMHRIQAPSSEGIPPVCATALVSWALRDLSRRMPSSRRTGP
jgi:hypothetical protein